MVLLVLAVVFVGVLVGGLSQVSSQSKGYDSNSERVLAAQAAVLADESNATSAAVRSLMSHLPTQTRQSLQIGLDSAVQQSASQSAQAELAATSMPPSSSASVLREVFAERARSMADLRTAIDGFLGLQPLTTNGGSEAVRTSGTPPLLSADQATAQIADAGVLLARSDALWGSLRRAADSAISPARLPRSVWVTDPGLWQPAALAAQVDLITASPTLRASHDVVLRTVRLTPPALPPPAGTPAGISILSPTTQLDVTVVLANQGAADEPRVTTELTLAEQASGATTTRQAATALALGATATLPTIAFSVQPGSDYVLTVRVVLPPGQTLTLGTATQQQLRVAPAT